MNSKIVLTNSNGGNEYLYVTKFSRLYCSYNDNTNVLGLTQNIWSRFSYPSTSYTSYRSNDFNIDSNLTKFTYAGVKTKWFRLDVVCNIYKVGNITARNVEVQWRLNGIAIGPIRGATMNSDDSMIITGSGEVVLSAGDYIEPYIRNIENNDDCILKNCSFIIKEDPDYSFIL